MEYKHIIFDLDGTLIDTEHAVLKTWQFTLKEYHYEYSLEELHPVLGITTPKALEYLKVSVDENYQEKWMKNYGEFCREADFFTGTKEMLRELADRGYQLGIVSSRCRQEYNAYFGGFHLEDLFDRILLADDTKRHKPDPEPICKYAEWEGVPVSACIYVGDMPTDIACANSAGAASGLAAWNRSGILCREADFIFRSPEELLELL